MFLLVICTFYPPPKERVKSPFVCLSAQNFRVFLRNRLSDWVEICTIGATTHVECFIHLYDVIGYVVWQTYWKNGKKLDLCISEMPGVGLMVMVVGFGSKGLEFKYHSAVELIPGGVNSPCHPSEVGKMSASLLVYYVGVATHPGFCPIAKETA